MMLRVNDIKQCAIEENIFKSIQGVCNLSSPLLKTNFLHFEKFFIFKIAIQFKQQQTQICNFYNVKKCKIYDKLKAMFKKVSYNHLIKIYFLSSSVNLKSNLVLEYTLQYSNTWQFVFQQIWIKRWREGEGGMVEGEWVQTKVISLSLFKTILWIQRLARSFITIIIITKFIWMKSTLYHILDCIS